MVSKWRYICAKCNKVYEPLLEEFPGPTECECGSRDFEKFPWEFFEKIAALEHDQWVEWSQSLAKAEMISEERLARWKTTWKPYEQLTEEQKAVDRKYAVKVFDLIRTELKSNVKRAENPDK